MFKKHLREYSNLESEDLNKKVLKIHCEIGDKEKISTDIIGGKEHVSVNANKKRIF